MRKLHLSGGKVSARFLRINIALFVIVTVLILAVMFYVLRDIADTVSEDYAKLYSSNVAGAFNTYLGGEIALIAKSAHSREIAEWFADEDDPDKKQAAYDEMMDTIEVSSSKNLYIGIAKTLHEFTVEKDFAINDIKSFATLVPGYFDDAWYFECVASDKEYLLNVDVDKIYHRKRVWLNYKVTSGDAVIGVLCTGLEFSNLAEKLFADYNKKSVRGLIIDEKGVIHMDSDLLGDDNFLLYNVKSDYRIEQAVTNPEFLSVVNEYTAGIKGYFGLDNATTVIELSSGRYSYATIAPITATTWSVVTFYDSSSLFSMGKLLPLFVIIPVIFIIFVLAIGLTVKRVIFTPFGKLIDSIATIKANMNEHVYGTERSDEIGELANTVQSMKDNLIDALVKVHYDVLTGIYNRRYLEENLSKLVKSLSRSGGVLSVMMLDADFFKNYNDTYGHSMGDDCLKTIAAALAVSVERDGDFVARYGGEEFVVVLPNTDEAGARIMAERILENIRSCQIPHQASDVAPYVTISIGVATGDATREQTGDDYIKRADEALYASKHGGRNRYTFLGFPIAE